MRHFSRREFIVESSAGVVALAAGGIVGFGDKAIAATTKSSFPGLGLPPFLGKPKTTEISINLVAAEKPLRGFLEYRPLDHAGTSYNATDEILLEPFSPKEIVVGDLKPGTDYEYRLNVSDATDGMNKEKYPWRAQFSTPPDNQKDFTFCLFSDSHITPFHQKRMDTLASVADSIKAQKTAFGMMLGDNIQTISSHGGPLKEKQHGPLLYAHLRTALGDLPSEVPLYSLVGNWEGENGWHSEEARLWARQARTAFIPTLDATTYPESGSPFGDYYGFTRGDVLFLALNVTGYTKADHSLGSTVGRPDDWTLGDEQKNWLYGQLSKSNARWKLIFIHHTVGGNGGDSLNSRYGRGGGRAAKVGEQALLHGWMKNFGVQALFYGHDHVFTDIPVDGIHYVCVGSAGAPWRFEKEVTGYNEFIADPGYTLVDVAPGRLKVDFIRPDPTKPFGEILHSFEIR